MLDVIRRTKSWLGAGIIVLVGITFVVYLGFGGPAKCTASSHAVIQVGDIAYYNDDFQRARAEQEEYHRRLLGDQFDPAAAADYLRSATANMLISRAILASEARALGLSVSKEELRRDVRESPRFRDAQGHFQVKEYREYAEWEYGNEANFLAARRRDLLVQKMLMILGQTAHVSQAEALDAARQSQEEVRLAFVVLDPGSAVPADSLDAAEVELYASTNEAALRERYDADPKRFERPAEIRARHILLKLPADAPKAEVARRRAEAEAILARIRGGEDFAAVAKQVSEDTAAGEGGDLGVLHRGDLDAEVEDVAFKLAPGETSDVIRGPAGFQILRVDERSEAGVRPFEDVRLQLARETLAAERGAEQARAQAEKLRSLVEGGESLESAARSLGVSIERTPWIRRRPDGFLPGLGASKDVYATAFSLDPAAPSSTRIFEVDGKLALIELLERREPTDEELAQDVAAEHDRLLQQEQQQVISDWIDVRRAALQSQGRLLVNLDLLKG